MSDWEEVNFGSPQQNPEPSASAAPVSDWHEVATQMPERPKENYGFSLAMAIPRMGEDALRSVGHIVKNAPEYWQNIKSGVPAAYNTLLENPQGAGKQALAGLGEQGQKLLNIPSDIVDYGQNRLHLLPDVMKAWKPKDISGDINQLLGSPQNAGEEAIRFAGRNALNLTGATGALKTLNPMQLTYKNMAKNVLKTEKQMINKYSGKNGLYNQLSDEASRRGITQANINPANIDLATIKKYSSEKNYASLENFLNNKNLTNAQKAISDLGHTERRLDNKTTLNSEERDQLKAVRNAKNHIQENMFKDASGKVHEDLLNKHKAIQKGYANEVIPYTKNAAIKAYKKGEKLPAELINSLSRGKFAAKRGKYHRAIAIRNFLNPTWGKVGAAGALGLLYHQMMGTEPEHKENIFAK